MGRTLSKSRFQKGLQCEKALWLGVHRKDLAAPPDEVQQWIFDQGHEVGLLARELFPGGAEVSEDYMHQADALETTKRLLAEGATILYEAAFEFGGAFTRADIMVAAGDGLWDLYEVKSSNSLKDVHVTDAAVQSYAIEGAGLNLRTINVVHLDPAYIYAGGAYDTRALFAVENITDEAREFMRTVPETIERLQAVLEGPEPEVLIGTRCSKPYPCEYAEYCHAFLPCEHPVTQLPRLSEPQLHRLIDAGLTCILDIPPDFGGFTAPQRETIAAVQAGEPRVDARALASALGGLEWPVYHLDFETVMPALPLWAGTHSYQTIPFQYSVHVHREDGTTEHREFLHVGTADPRRPLAEKMIADLGETGSIVHYTSFERTRIDELTAALPDLAPALAAIRSRLFDLEPLIMRYTRHPKAAGRSSVKYTLPAWCPDLSYEGLPIADGQTASVRYLRILKGVAGEDEAQATLSALAEYCALDTYAMVRLLEEMMKQAAG